MLGLALGGGLALLASARPFATVSAARPRPLPDLSADLAGRTLEPATAGLAVVLLAGAVAVPAVRGRARQIVGVVLVLSAAALAWRAALGIPGPDPGRARDLLLQARTGVTLPATSPVAVHVHPVWPALAILGAVLALVAGLLSAVHGRAWTGLGRRYDAPAAAGPPPADEDPSPSGQNPEQEAERRARADLALWQSLDRGEDPTVRG